MFIVRIIHLRFDNVSRFIYAIQIKFVVIMIFIWIYILLYLGLSVFSRDVIIFLFWFCFCLIACCWFCSISLCPSVSHIFVVFRRIYGSFVADDDHYRPAIDCCGCGCCWLHNNATASRSCTIADHVAGNAAKFGNWQRFLKYHFTIGHR